METLLMVAVIITTVAVVAQAGALVGMFLLTSRVKKNADSLMNDGRRLMVPIEPVIHNFKVVSNDVVELSRTARRDFERVAGLASDAGETIRMKVHHLQNTVMSPVRFAMALAAGMREGMRVLLHGKSERRGSGDTGYRAA
jgi:hypothetical protein